MSGRDACYEGEGWRWRELQEQHFSPENGQTPGGKPHNIVGSPSLTDYGVFLPESYPLSLPQFINYSCNLSTVSLLNLCSSIQTPSVPVSFSHWGQHFALCPLLSSGVKKNCWCISLSVNLLGWSASFLAPYECKSRHFQHFLKFIFRMINMLMVAQTNIVGKL